MWKARRRTRTSLTFSVQTPTTAATAAQPADGGDEKDWCVVGDDDAAGDDEWVEDVEDMRPQVSTISGGLR